MQRPMSPPASGSTCSACAWLSVIERPAGGDVIRARLLTLPAAKKEAVFLAWSPHAAVHQLRTEPLAPVHGRSRVTAKADCAQNPMHLYGGRFPAMGNWPERGDSRAPAQSTCRKKGSCLPGLVPAGRAISHCKHKSGQDPIPLYGGTVSDPRAAGRRPMCFARVCSTYLPESRTGFC